MSEQPTLEEIARKQVVYSVPGMDDVVVREGVAYYQSGEDSLAMNIYLPPGTPAGAQVPAVVLVMGYPFPISFLKTWGPAISWARLLAASGMAAIVYANREPAADARRLLDFLREQGGSWGIDRERLGLWSSSGNVPTALSLLIQGDCEDIRCGAFCYGYMLDSGGADVVAAAAAAYGFANPCAGKGVADIASDVHLLIVRAGQDQFAGLNDTIDSFVAGARALNRPVTLVRHDGGGHGFDLDDDSAASRAIVRRILEFLRLHLV